MRYDVIVVGAGMVGTSIAWHLQKNHSKVLLLDKKAPGSETSYGNAGLIQREAIRPYAFPRQLTEILRVLPNTSTDIRYRWPAIFQYSQSLLHYWMNSAPANFQKIEQEWQTLIEHCTDEHQVMITASGADDLVRRKGWIELYRTESKLKAAVELAVKAEEIGVQHKVLNVEELQALEPNCNFTGFVGAIHWLNSWQVANPGELVKAYAKSFQAMSGTIEQGSIKALVPEADGWQVKTDNQSYHSEHLVIAAGPWSSDLIKPLGYKIPLFPMRGYHQHFELSEHNLLNHSLIDKERGFVMGPMQQGIRITTGAEMTLPDSAKNFGQLQSVLKYAKEILPLEKAVEAEAWSGSRPCMPDMKPVLGAADKHDKLWFAFGHAHQGFTLGPVTGRLIEELIHNKPVFINVEPFSSKRFAK